MAGWLIALLQLGINSEGGLAVGSSLALTAFAFFRIVSAFECRSERDTVLAIESTDNRQLNMIVLVELVLAFLVTEMDIFHKLLGTAPLSVEQWALTLAAGVSLFVAWEIGKLVVRRVEPAPAAGVATSATAV